jgi:hypothetical protein
LVLVACGLYLAVQVLLPAVVRQPEDRPAQFAWQMFGRGGEWHEFVVDTPEGQQRYTVGEVAVRARVDVDYSQHIPAHLCRVEPAAERVTILTSEGERVGELACP